MNPMNLLQLKPAWDQFRSNHPKLIQFIKASAREDVMDEGTLIEINIKTSAGKSLSSNIRESDLEFLRALKDIAQD